MGVSGVLARAPHAHLHFYLETRQPAQTGPRIGLAGGLGEGVCSINIKTAWNPKNIVRRASGKNPACVGGQGGTPPLHSSRPFQPLPASTPAPLVSRLFGCTIFSVVSISGSALVWGVPARPRAFAQTNAGGGGRLTLRPSRPATHAPSISWEHDTLLHLKWWDTRRRGRGAGDAAPMPL